MLLVVDVGNTNTVFGAYKNKELIMNFRLGTEKRRTSDEYGVLVRELFMVDNYKLEDVKSVIVSSVVPDAMYALESFSIKYCNKRPLIVGSGLETGLSIKHVNPKELGTDRIVNAVAALEKFGAPLVIIDFGTATTFCAINENKEYIGGAISPGVRISSEALFEKTSKLPKVELIKTNKIIGTNTVVAMQSGIINGYSGLVKHIVLGIIQELNTEKKVNVVATGGLAPLICGNLEIVDSVDKNLTLEGLRLIYERNIEIAEKSTCK